MSSEPSSVLELAAALGYDLYDWQKEILMAIELCALEIRRKFAVAAPNGVGKTGRLVALSAMRWLQRFPKGRVVITSYSRRQIDDQLWPAIMSRLSRFQGWKANATEHTITGPAGGRIRAFCTDDAGRAEGFHADLADDAPLLVIVDEAKSIDPEIFKAIDRCTYNVLLYVSSPGLMVGPFYDAFTRNRSRFICWAITLKDCPHVPREKIQDTIDQYGETDPFVRSTIFGEFMKHSDDIQMVLTLDDIEFARGAQLEKLYGDVVAGVDFAAGRAQNVLCKRNGNHVDALRSWREKDTYSAVGRFVLLFNELAIKPQQIWADADGLGGPLCDHLAKVGFKLNRFYGNGKSPHKRYVNLISYCWHETANQLKRSKILFPFNQPYTDELISQLTSRRVAYKPDGRLGLEDKESMRDRGIASPDLGDAFAMAFSQHAVGMHSWTHEDQESRFAEVAARRGWEYTPGDSEISEPGRPWQGNGGGLSHVGIHSEW